MTALSPAQRPRAALAALALAVCAASAACGSSAQPTAGAARPEPQTGSTQAPQTPQLPPTPHALGVTAADGVRLEVTGVHLLLPTPGDPAAQAVAAAQRVRVQEVGQMHLVLVLRNTTSKPRVVAGDELQLGLGSRTVDAVQAADVFPDAPLAPEAGVDTGVAFDVVVKGGTGPVTLRWTHAGVTEVVPIGGLGVGG